MKSTHVIFKKLPGWIDLYLTLGSHIYQAWNHCRFSTQEALGEKQEFKPAVFHHSSSPFLSQTSFSENLEVYHACFSTNDLPGRVTKMLAQINEQREDVEERKTQAGFRKLKIPAEKTFGDDGSNGISVVFTDHISTSITFAVMQLKSLHFP